MAVIRSSKVHRFIQHNARPPASGMVMKRYGGRGWPRTDPPRKRGSVR